MSGATPGLVHQFKADAPVSSGCLVGPSTIAYGTTQGNVFYVNPYNGINEATWAAHPNQNVGAMIFLKRTPHLVTGGENDVGVWSASGVRRIHMLAGHTNKITSLTELADGNIASGSSDRNIRVWDLRTGNCLHTLSGHSFHVYSMLPLANGRILSGSFDDSMRVWDPKASGSQEIQRIGTGRGVISLAQMHDGTYAVGLQEGSVKIYDGMFTVLRTMEKVSTDYVRRVVQLNTSTIVACADDSVVLIHDLATGKKLHEIRGSSGYLHVLLQLATGDIVVSGQDGIIRTYATGAIYGTAGGAPGGGASSLLSSSSSPSAGLMPISFADKIAAMTAAATASAASAAAAATAARAGAAGSNKASAPGTAAPSATALQDDGKAAAAAAAIAATSATSAILIAKAEGDLQEARAEIQASKLLLAGERERRAKAETEALVLQRRTVDLSEQLAAARNAESKAIAASEQAKRAAKEVDATVARAVDAAVATALAANATEMHARRGEAKEAQAALTALKRLETVAEVSNIIKRQRWGALATLFRTDRLAPYTILPDGKSLLETAESARFSRGAACAEAYQEAGALPPALWRPDMFEAWFEFCVPSLDATRIPELVPAVKSMYPIVWKRLADRPSLRAHLAKAGLPPAAIELFEAECDELARKNDS